MRLFARTSILAVLVLGACTPSDPPSDPGIENQPGLLGETTGLRGEYFDNVDFTTLKIDRVDQGVNLSWGRKGPGGGIAGDTFSARWTGRVVPLYTETYTFFVNSDDGARLFISGQKVLERWTNGGGEVQGTISLEAGREYDLRLEYYNAARGGYAALSWASARQAKQIIPAAQLRPPGAPAPAPAPAPSPSTTRSAFSTIEAESFDSHNGVVVSGGMIGYLDNGDYIKFNSVDFGGGANAMDINLAVDPVYAGQFIDLRTDGPTGPLVGTLTVANTGGWGTFAVQSASITPISGVHPIVLVFRGTGGIANVDRLVFRQASAPAPAPTPTPTPTPTSTPATGKVVPLSFFGMHMAAQTFMAWPVVRFATNRLWDAYPFVSWWNLHTARGVYDWANLDLLVNDSIAHGVDMVYTFGRTPPWAANGNTCGCVAPANIQDWKDFVTQITARYKGKIKYWELWNEPNAGNFWSGTHAQMVAMASAAYPIIKAAGGTVLSPAPQGVNAYVWMDQYFAAGGKAYADIVAYHGYIYGDPEGITPLINNMRSVAAKYGLSGAQLWDTENSWGGGDWPYGADMDRQSAYLSRFLINSFSSGVDRSFWYCWGSFDFGQLIDRQSGTFLKTGVAYREVQNWMIDAAFETCTVSGTVHRCRLTRAGGYEAFIIWNNAGASAYTPGTGFTRYKTLDATTVPIAAGGSVTLGIKPILVEKPAP
jgi:hypothetical protein